MKLKERKVVKKEIVNVAGINVQITKEIYIRIHDGKVFGHAKVLAEPYKD